MLCPCFKYESGLKKTDMHVVRQTSFYCHICKSCAKLWLMHSKVFKRESKTMNILQQFYVRDIILLSCNTFLFFCFLIRNFNLFCSSFYSCNWPKNSTTMFISGTTLIKNGLSFPPPRLFRATRLLGREEYIYIYNVYTYIYIYVYIYTYIHIYIYIYTRERTTISRSSKTLFLKYLYLIILIQMLRQHKLENTIKKFKCTEKRVHIALGHIV